MAGAGYKLFNTGDVLTAAQVNTYLQEQVVMVFASAAARTTALSGVLAEGMVSYLKDTDALEIYSGSAWVGYGSGDITAVVAGTGLSGGATSGSATLSLTIPVVESSGGTNQTTYATGDLLYASAANTLSKRTIGTSGQVLTVSGGVPTWATAASGVTYVGASLYRDNNNQSITQNTATAILFPNEEWDTDGFHSTSTNTSRFTIPTGKGGKYQLNVMQWYSSTPTSSQLYLYKNGSAITGNGMNVGIFGYSTGPADITIGTVTFNAVAGDYFEVFTYHSSTGARNINYVYANFSYLGA